MTRYYQSGHLYCKTLGDYETGTAINLVNITDRTWTVAVVSSNFFELFRPCDEYVYEAAQDMVERTGVMVQSATYITL
jgi:hypothetical protein